MASRNTFNAGSQKGRTSKGKGQEFEDVNLASNVKSTKPIINAQGMVTQQTTTEVRGGGGARAMDQAQAMGVVAAEQVQEAYEQGKEQASGILGAVQSALSGTIHKVEETLESAKHVAENVFVATEEKMEGAYEQAATTTSGLLGNVVDTVAHVKDRAIDTITGTLHGVVEGTRDIATHTVDATYATAEAAKERLYHGVEAVEQVGMTAAHTAYETTLATAEAAKEKLFHAEQAGLSSAQAVLDATRATAEVAKEKLYQAEQAGLSSAHTAFEATRATAEAAKEKLSQGAEYAEHTRLGSAAVEATRATTEAAKEKLSQGAEYAEHTRLGSAAHAALGAMAQKLPAAAALASSAYETGKATLSAAAQQLPSAASSAEATISKLSDQFSQMGKGATTTATATTTTATTKTATAPVSRVHPPPDPSKQWLLMWEQKHPSFDFDSFRWHAAQFAQSKWIGQDWIGDQELESGGWQEAHYPPRHHRSKFNTQFAQVNIPKPPPVPTQAKLEELSMRKNYNFDFLNKPVTQEKEKSEVIQEIPIPQEKESFVHPGHSFLDAVKDNIGSQQTTEGSSKA